MKTIPLTRGYNAVIDDDDYPIVSKFKWRVLLIYRKDKTIRGTYARTDVKDEHGVYRTIYLHDMVMPRKKGMAIDHINGDGLDNRKINLRICTVQENLRNQRSIYGTSKFKGVSWCPRNSRWRVSIGLNDKRIYVGMFLSEKDAGNAYNLAALRLYGDFALLNEVI